MGAQYTYRGPHTACRQPACGLPDAAKSVLILAQKWLLCTVLNDTSNVLQLSNAHSVYIYIYIY